MKFEEQKIKGVWIIQPRVIEDSRGYFMESFKLNEFQKRIGNVNFIQDNESQSLRGVLRGMHYQKGEYSQAKLVRVIRGSVLDVVVDLRKSSASFGQYVAVNLSAENKRQLFVPRGMAHGFLVLEDDTIFSYKVDNRYAAAEEACLLWNDKEIDINWNFPEDELIMSEKDRQGDSLSETALFE